MEETLKEKKVDVKPESILDPETPTIEKPMTQEKMVKEIPMKNDSSMYLNFFIGIVVLLLGIGTGWGAAGMTSAAGSVAGEKAEVNEEQVATSEDITEDESAFPLVGEGVLRDGGINGDGTHFLDRDGDNNVALLSTVLSLDSFLGKRVEIWGKTLSSTGEDGNWLVDVTKVKLLE